MSGATATVGNVAVVMTREELSALIAAEVESRLREVQPDGWLDTPRAAAYAGTTPNALHKATAARALRFEQDCAGGKCWFKRSWLDDWRQHLAADS